MKIHYTKGLHLPDHGLWLDSRTSRAVGVVTHAHGDHAAWHKQTITTPATAALMRSRRPDRNRTVYELAYGKTHCLTSSRVTLFPAGHVLGSAQAYVETAEGTLLYTGDFKLRAGLAAEPLQIVHADTLVMECTFGLPQYRFPSREQIQEQILDFCDKTMREHAVPVLFGYSIGKAQELLAILNKGGFPALLHPAAYRVAKVYEQFGIPFGKYAEFTGGSCDGQVLIFLPNARATLLGMGLTRMAMVTGWGLDRGAIYRYGCEAVFPLSDHADYEELLEYVDRVSPRRIYTVHGFVEEFASDLRRRGKDALALGGKNQLELDL